MARRPRRIHIDITDRHDDEPELARRIGITLALVWLGVSLCQLAGAA